MCVPVPIHCCCCCCWLLLEIMVRDRSEHRTWMILKTPVASTTYTHFLLYSNKTTQPNRNYCGTNWNIFIMFIRLWIFRISIHVSFCWDFEYYLLQVLNGLCVCVCCLCIVHVFRCFLCVADIAFSRLEWCCVRCAWTTSCNERTYIHTHAD